MGHSRAFALSGALLLVATQMFSSTVSSAERQRATPPSTTETTLPAGNVEHGQYLAENVAMCIECHSARDPQGNLVPSEHYMGGSIPFSPPWPNDWATRAPRNRGLPGYTDEMGIRLLTQGAIDRNGVQLRPPMPKFRMTPQDAADVVAYLKSLP